MATRKPTLESILANALLEEKHVTFPDLGKPILEFHFAGMTVQEVQATPDENLVPILSANRIVVSSPAPDQSELRRLVLFEKCLHLHMFNFTVRQGRTCGYCREVIHISKLCGQCKVYRYCNKECQGKHWRAHKVFCGLQRERTDKRNSLLKEHLSDDANILERTNQTAMSKIWDGKENDYFDRTLALFLQNGIMFLGVAYFLKSLPPNVAQAHGPAEFWKMAVYVMDKIEATDFAHEKNEWLSVLGYCFDPHWPESYDDHNETLFLKPNVEAFVYHGGLSRLLQMMLSNPVSVDAFTAVLHNLSCYRDIIQVATEEPLRKPANVGFIFDSLSQDIKQIIFHDFLRDFTQGTAGLVDQLNFGRSCRAAAHTICAVLDKTCKLTFKKGGDWDVYNSILNNGETQLVENELDNLSVNEAAQAHPEWFLRPDVILLVFQIDGLSKMFEKNNSNLRRMYCAMLQARFSLQIDSGCCYAEEVVPSGLTRLEILLLRASEETIRMHRRWVASYSRIAAWIRKQAQ